MDLLFTNDRQGEYPPSFYAATADALPPFPPLAGEARADVCIVGGGYTGLSAAMHLARAGLSVILLEAHRVGFGASGRNGGQVGSGQRLEQDALERLMGLDDARRLWDMAEEAKALIRTLAAEAGVPFHAGVAHACWTDAEVRHSHDYAEKLSRDYGYDMVEPMDRARMAALIPSGVFAGGDLDRGAGHLHPLNFALGLARMAASAGAQVHENSLVTAVEHGAKACITTTNGTVTADHLILACNGYLGRIEPKVAARVMPINNFIVATEPLGNDAAKVLAENVAVADTKFVVNYWRLSEDNRLLFGGGESFGYRFPDISATVRRPLATIYPALRDIRFDYAWGGTLAITMTRLPCFLRVAPNAFSASGYSGHGVAMATLAGKVLADAVRGQAGQFDLMSRLPTPRFPGGSALRHPLMVLAMTWYGMRDRLGL